MNQKDQQLYNSQVQVDVTFTAFMTAVVIFFTGMLLTSYDSYDVSVKVPVSFLIISFFGFLYSTIIFANASANILKNQMVKAIRHNSWGDSISEYIGVYLLVLSIPLVINVITTDQYLRIITLISSLGGLMLYQFSNLSLMSWHFNKIQNNLLSVVILLFECILYFAQINSFYFTQISIVFLIFMFVVTYTSLKMNS